MNRFLAYRTRKGRVSKAGMMNGSQFHFQISLFISHLIILTSAELFILAKENEARVKIFAVC
jgi:hypothetical protein